MAGNQKKKEDERRRRARRTVVWRATVATAQGEQKGWVRNISAAGMALQTETPLAMRTAVTILLEKHGALDGFVVWTQDVLHGIAFVQEPAAIIERFGAEAARLGMQD
jgi:PilZ domain